MVPLDLDALECDFYGGNCHKWLLAPTGSGFLYLGKGGAERLQPLQVSWGWHHDRARADERDEYGATPRLRAFEFEGTRDPCPWLCVPTAIDFQSALGWKRIRERIVELVRFVRAQLSDQVGLRLTTPTDSTLHGAITAFRLPAGTHSPALRRSLWEEHRIEVPIIDRPEGPLLRVSTHFYNTEQEIDRLARALSSLLGKECSRGVS
jgi:isopenicillin-N epimerase